MWILIPLFFTLVYLSPGLAAMVWGLIVIIRRKTWLTRRKTIVGAPAVVLGLTAIALGIAYSIFFVYWAVVHYPRGW
jgi:hypothetical protein